MKITAIELGMLRVPLKTPFKTALRTVETVEDVVVLIRTDTGNTGYGEAPATAVITGDTHGSIIEAIRHFIAPRLIGQDVANLNRLCGLVQTAMERNTSAKAAVEIALYDLWAQLHGAPLYQMLGGGDPVITTDITISVDYIDKMVADSLSAIERGFESLKIKVGKDIGLDIERVKAIHAAVEGRALLRLDANQGWTAKQAVHGSHVRGDLVSYVFIDFQRPDLLADGFCQPCRRFTGGCGKANSQRFAGLHRWRLEQCQQPHDRGGFTGPRAAGDDTERTAGSQGTGEFLPIDHFAGPGWTE